MHRQVPVPQQVYRRLFPAPVKDKDPVSWADHVKKNLVIEIRLVGLPICNYLKRTGTNAPQEVQLFYGNDPGDLTAESRFPGFDYSSPHHRMRLRRHAHHRRLFRAFDDLHSTEHEIYTLCDWEGTLIVRHRYELQNQVRLRDTTGDDILERMERERVKKEALMQARIEAEEAEEAAEAEGDTNEEQAVQTQAFAEHRGGLATGDLISSDLTEDEVDMDADIDEPMSDPEGLQMLHSSMHRLSAHGLIVRQESADPRVYINWQGAVRNMTPEQALSSRRQMTATPRITRGGTPATRVGA